MNVVEFFASVRIDDGFYEFVCTAYCTTDPGDRLIDSEFYEHCGNGVPVGDHWEMEVNTCTPSLQGKGIHVHVNPKTKRTFVCLPHHIPTEQDAWTFFLAWAAGTAHTLRTGEDFSPLLTVPIRDFPALLEATRGVTIVAAQRSYGGSINPFRNSEK